MLFLSLVHRSFSTHGGKRKTWAKEENNVKGHKSAVTRPCFCPTKIMPYETRHLSSQPILEDFSGDVDPSSHGVTNESSNKHYSLLHL